MSAPISAPRSGARGWTLTLRVSALFALIACLVVAGLGWYLYGSVREALELRADQALTGRVEHFRNLMHDLDNVEQMEQRPALFESMMGNEQDVRIFRRRGEAPFIQSNPEHLVPPEMEPVPVGTPLSAADLFTTVRADGVRIRWVAALAEVGSGQDHADTVEIVAAYVMVQEAGMLRSYRWRIAGAAAGAVLLTALLGFLLLRHGLRPLLEMSRRAAQITPDRLSMRLEQEGMPQELRRVAVSFNAMLDRLEAGYEHLSQFSGDLAHEIRTPVNVLMGQSQVALGQRRSPEEYEQLLESNVEELQRISRIVENIMFLAQADHATLAVDCAALELREELGKIVDYFEGIADERGMRFALEAEGSCHANLVMWRRAVSNLVINAVRYGEADSTVRIIARSDGNGSSIIVENRSDDATPHTMARMFDRFYRGDRSRSAYTESNGLGLAIVKAIMALHRGTATVECPQPGWIRFTLHFPPASAPSPSSIPA
ncbi:MULTISPECIES: heavy metal sensor histidine kinase [unclassified Herbaspirillum]|uniref:heavy metal sensor histidine kinase n=1 Tax=unclassified Herbaspirillum TaxID=2624150 RepID=UPI00116DDA8F|nr:MULTISPECIES: heavy metal sensor histidine kinase [unclassified Herbaspirillum]MBB5390879.1 two-component system heavy metal sensor histidine kinase CusS [Herbaspirillum sp. SJZ102]TQK06403.1 two-component system heavy metal sensor histidine kinase CusS [Herbaspirillum sp. SJZ130]TQK12119.1 two-component system heavy metal sensor histidine kinase CusS [Herbaspirillum sp. SJZ106]